MEEAPESSTTESVTSVSSEKIQSLLRAKDDTSRFVGLAILKAVLDNERSPQEPEALKILWESISPKFLDRLLRADRNEKISKDEAKDMVDLAVAVLHTFSVLLPEESRKDSRLTKRTATLVNALLTSSLETTNVILQTLVTIVSQPEGALEFLKLEDNSPLTEIATFQPLALKVLNFAWTNASIVPAGISIVRQTISEVIPKLLVSFEDTDAVTLIESVGDFLPNMNPEAIPSNPEWLPRLVQVLRNLVSSRPTLTGRTAYTKLASALLQVYPTTTPILLFRDGASGGAESKPFSYLLINLLLIDLRSSFPSLLPKLNRPEYPPISQRLSAAFDILSSFIGFLVKSLDEEEFTPGFSIAPDLLLKLRKDIAETMSLTIEHLRDRWDASIAGASGLHESARAGTSATSEGTRLTLTWDSMKGDVTADPLILAGIRGIAIWIREDDNENLRNEAAGLMDMLLELYKQGGQDSQFRYPILLALEGIMTIDAGAEMFLGQEGWQILSQDLQSIFKLVCGITPAGILSPSSEAARGTQIIRVLLGVLDHPSTSFPEEIWMEAVKLTTSIKVPTDTPSSAVLEVLIASLQLSTALLSKSSGGMTKRYITSQPALRGLAKQLKTIAAKLQDQAEVEDFMGLLDEVLMDLQNLGSG